MANENQTKTVLVFDENSNRLSRNRERLITNSMDVVASLRINPFMNEETVFGLIDKRRYDLYVLNQRSPKFYDVFEYLLLVADEKRYSPHLIIIGDADSTRATLAATSKELPGVKLAFKIVDKPNGCLDCPLDLEKALANLSGFEVLA